MKFLLFVALFSANIAVGALPEHIKVQGHCEIKVVPDRGSVTFMAENQSRDQKEAVAKTTKQINDLREKLITLKLAHQELKTGQYNVFVVREYEKDRMVEKGTRASLSLELTTSEVTRLGEAMAKASEIGIQNVGTFKTFLSLEKSQAEYLKCLDIAASDAEDKAKRLAKKLDFKIGDVVRVIEKPAPPQPPIPLHMDMAMAKSGRAEAEAAQIDAGEVPFSTDIEVYFSIK